MFNHNDQRSIWAQLQATNALRQDLRAGSGARAGAGAGAEVFQSTIHHDSQRRARTANGIAQTSMWAVPGPLSSLEPTLMAMSTSDAGPQTVLIDSIEFCRDELTGVEQTKITFNVHVPLNTAIALLSQQGGVPIAVHEALPPVLNLEMMGTEFQIRISPSTVAVIERMREEDHRVDSVLEAVSQAQSQVSLPPQQVFAQEAPVAVVEHPASADEKIYQPKMTDVVFGRYVSKHVGWSFCFVWIPHA